MLQRSIGELVASSTSLEGQLKGEDSSTAQAGRTLTDVCKGLGVMLVGLASALSGEVLAPLQELRRGVEADRASRQEELARLRQSELLCSNTLTECLQKKDRARVGLQGALRERDKTQRDLEKRNKSLGWLKKRPDDVAAAAETKLQKAASLQTAAIEELAVRTDEAMLARMRAHEGAQALSETLGLIDVARKNLLCMAFGKCAVAWDEAAGTLQTSAEHFRTSALKLSQVAACSEGSGHQKPRWLVPSPRDAGESVASTRAELHSPVPTNPQQSPFPASPRSERYGHAWHKPINPFEDEGKEGEWDAREESRHAGDAGSSVIMSRRPSLAARRDVGVDAWAQATGSMWRGKALLFDEDLSEEEV
mmetsp:Transcript_40713/g.94394  ORF Transcript_40713/g.94394 Transcript_40713/m.94394 type:complete len:365 (-) Transcript_40713:48-1142(-)